jgi:hypothetical protein
MEEWNSYLLSNFDIRVVRMEVTWQIYKYGFLAYDIL